MKVRCLRCSAEFETPGNDNVCGTCADDLRDQISEAEWADAMFDIEAERILTGEGE